MNLLKIKWSLVIENIELNKKLGMPLYRRLSVDPERLFDIKAGLVEPTWSEGVKLLDIHLDLCPTEHNTIA